MTATTIRARSAAGCATRETTSNPNPPALPRELSAEFERRLANGELELPLLPGVAMEVTSAAGRDDVDARQLADLLKRDAAIAAHVLRVVNSPLYGSRGQVVSLQQAVSRVGSAKIRDIALIVACRASVFEVPGYEGVVDDVFQHSVLAALIGQEIARLTRNNVEEAFLCGLLHDIGRPVILQSLLRIAGVGGRALERDAVLAYTTALHCRAGAALAVAWALPESVQSSIAEHHEPLGAAQPASLHIAGLADSVAHLALDAKDPGGAPLLAHPALQKLEIYPDALQKIIDRAAALRDTAKALS